MPLSYIWKAAVADGVFGKVFFGQDLFDPGIDGEGVDVVEAEKADAVGYLLANAVKAGKILHGSFIVQCA